MHLKKKIGITNLNFEINFSGKNIFLSAVGEFKISVSSFANCKGRVKMSFEQALMQK